VRGALTGWYPYSFLDPAASGLLTAVATAAVIVLAGLGLGVLYVRLARYSAARRMAPSQAVSDARGSRR
ncbi:MAG TPA: Pr6Pr family membrane protein, partial [Candidatus Limnocylindria bacterium]|nr:Pr6Pr family membrane protein [Candidatus Limnocylindria bacterium]